jgi:hypothetical protein
MPQRVVLNQLQPSNPLKGLSGCHAMEAGLHAERLEKLGLVSLGRTSRSARAERDS